MARGELRVYLGVAQGVGKTVAMLQEGRSRAAAGTDVVAGFVETHGRAGTIAELGALEVLPRRVVSYRGLQTGEMDLPGLLDRAPALVLIDELAHPNIDDGTGQRRHRKRWQDVQQVLAAGIDVITTINVQHLESLTSVVTSITGVRPSETVPDRVVRSAESIELVDLDPRSLRRRLVLGDIHRAEHIDAALTSSFREDVITALRVLSMTWLADPDGPTPPRRRA